MVSQLSATTILYSFRKKLDERIKFHKTVSYSLLGVLIIDFIGFLFGKHGALAVIGVFLTFMWIVHLIFAMMELGEQKRDIDELYLELKMRKDNDGKDKKNKT